MVALLQRLLLSMAVSLINIIMYKRYLNNNDYLSIVTEEALSQLIRGKEERLAQAEESAEASIVEYLTDNYEIEKVLEAGKNILPYNDQITYPVGAHFYYNDEIVHAMRTINGRKAPMESPYWELYEDLVDEPEKVFEYWQTRDYVPGDIVTFNGLFYKCLNYNGLSYSDIRVPGINAWEEVDVENWEANVPYELWAVVSYESSFYTLIKTDDDIDLTINPYDSDYWGMIGDYDVTYAQYDFSDHEYVVYNNKVYAPTMDVNADELKNGYNIQPGDPRNPNVKKHLLRLAIYELHKLISPNNVSSARITDYETSITWLRDASRLKINPKIPRKIDDENKPVTEYAIATYARDYDPYKNPWQV